MNLYLRSYGVKVFHKILVTTLRLYVFIHLAHAQLMVPRQQIELHINDLVFMSLIHILKFLYFVFPFLS